MTKQIIGIGELLFKTYEKICKKYNAEEVVFDGFVTVTADEDGDRDQKMEYNRIGLFKINNKEWALSKGVGSGTLRPVPDSDLVAFNYSKYKLDKLNRIRKKPIDEIKSDLYYKLREDCKEYNNSILIGTKYGQLATDNRSNFKQQIFHIILPECKKYIVESGNITKYKISFVDFLTDSLERLLKS